MRCPNCKTVNDPQIARTTNGVAEVVGPNSSAKRKASPTVRDYASPLCAFRAHAPRSLAAQNGPPAKRSSPTPQPKQPRPPSNGAGSSSDVKPEPEPPSGPRVDEILQMRPAARGGTEYLVKWRPEEGASAARPDSWETQSGLDQKAISAFHARQSNGNGAAYRSLSAVDERSPKSRFAARAAAPAAARPRAPAADARGAHNNSKPGKQPNSNDKAKTVKRESGIDVDDLDEFDIEEASEAISAKPKAVKRGGSGSAGGPGTPGGSAPEPSARRPRRTRARRRPP